MLKKIIKHKYIKNVLRILLISLLEVIIYLLVYISGGTKSSILQLIYIPIILSASYWGLKGSITVAILSGIILGPFMPLDVSLGIMQKQYNWILRLIIFVLVSFVVGYIFQKIKEINKRLREKDLKSVFTGLYNTNKLFLELNEMIENSEKFFFTIFKIINLEEINEYADNSIMKNIVHAVTANLKDSFNGAEIYSINFNEYGLTLKEYDACEIKQKLSKIINDASYSIKIENHVFSLQIKAGIVYFDGNEVDAIELYNKARIAVEQGGIYESGVYDYDPKIDYDRRLRYEIANSIYDAIKNNEFYLVYQPIISLDKNIISDAEVLVRWNRGDRPPVGPQIFIQIAEETGSVKKISKMIIEKNIRQIIEWKKKKISINTSINLTSKELIDNSFREWTRKIIEDNGIDKSTMRIEITERVFSKESKKLINVLLDTRAKGYKILIDDFGTGYNSLMIVGKIPFDIIKIDKYFIDNIDQLEIKILVSHIIDSVHEMGGTVIAEGVETKEQVEVLKQLRCDKVQGYYFSKPILPEDFEEYYLSFTRKK